MPEERIVEVEQPTGGTHTTIIEGSGSGRSGGWLIALVLVVALVVAGVFFLRSENRTSVRDNAIAEAAQDVGDAAQKVGDAAEEAARKLPEK